MTDRNFNEVLKSTRDLATSTIHNSYYSNKINKCLEKLEIIYSNRVTELLEANNREVERRRSAEKLLLDYRDSVGYILSNFIETFENILKDAKNSDKLLSRMYEDIRGLNIHE